MVLTDQFPALASHSHMVRWLSMNQDLEYAQSTVLAYAHNLQDYLSFCQDKAIDHLVATQEHIARYISHLRTRPVKRKNGVEKGLATATKRQRLSTLRLYYTFLQEENVRETNPVRRGNRLKSGFRNAKRGLISSQVEEIWIPNAAGWISIIDCMELGSLRNRVMLALAYEGAMRRSELCSLQLSDVNLKDRMLMIRAETTKTQQCRSFEYSAGTARLLAEYIAARRPITPRTNALFLSESSSNDGDPILRGTWGKVIESVAQQTGLLKFTTHTLRHLRISHLVRQGYSLVGISRFVGHLDINSTYKYTHLDDQQTVVSMARVVSKTRKTRKTI